MTDDELLAMLRERYHYLWMGLTWSHGDGKTQYNKREFADLRRLMAYCRTDVMVAAALQQSRKEEK